MFWGAIVKPNEPVKLVDTAESDILRLSTAVLGTQEKTGKTTLYAEVEGKKHILAHLVSDRTEQVSFDLYFRIDQDVTFTVTGKGEIHLGGYFEPEMDDDEDDDEDDFRALRAGADEDEDSEEDVKPAGKNGAQKGPLFGQNGPKQAQPIQNKAQQNKPQQPVAKNDQAKPASKQQSPKLAAQPTQGNQQKPNQQQQKIQPAKKPIGKALENLEDDDDDEDEDEDEDEDDLDDIDLEDDDDEDDDDDDDDIVIGQKPKGGPGNQPQKKVKGPEGKAIPNVNQALKQQGGKPQQQKPQGGGQKPQGGAGQKPQGKAKGGNK